MKIFKKSLIVLALSCSSAVADNGPNNVGVFCPETNICWANNGSCSDSINTTAGYWFRGKYVELHRVIGNEITHYDNNDVTLNGTSEIYFCDTKNPGDFCIYLDRKKLTLGSSYERQCELVDNKKHLFFLMKKDMAASRDGNKL